MCIYKHILCISITNCILNISNSISVSLYFAALAPNTYVFVYIYEQYINENIWSLEDKSVYILVIYIQTCWCWGLKLQNTWILK